MPVPAGYEDADVAGLTAANEVWYCTREHMQAALDQADSVRNNTRIDQAIRAGARELDGILHRRFWPQTGTRYPDVRWVHGDTLWVNDIDHEIISLTSLVCDGVTFVEGTDFYLDPDRYGPPYTAIRLLRDSSAAWPTDQRDIVMAGLFGGSSTSEPCGELAADIGTSAVTAMRVSDSAAVGVGDLVLVDAERVIVTDKALATTTVTLAGNIAASAAVTTVPVSAGELVARGETITVDAERMFVEDVAGDTLIVKRAVAASALAAHTTGDTVYAPRLCSIRRAVTGTTAFVHASGATLTRNMPPALVTEANLALAINYLMQGKSAYSRTVGSADTARPAPGADVRGTVESAYAAYGRQGRIGVCR